MDTRCKECSIHPMAEKNVIGDPKQCLMSRDLRLSYKASVLFDVAFLSDERTHFLAAQFIILITQ